MSPITRLLPLVALVLSSRPALSAPINGAMVPEHWEAKVHFPGLFSQGQRKTIKKPNAGGEVAKGKSSYSPLA